MWRVHLNTVRSISTETPALQRPACCPQRHGRAAPASATTVSRHRPPLLSPLTGGATWKRGSIVTCRVGKAAGGAGVGPLARGGTAAAPAGRAGVALAPAVLATLPPLVAPPTAGYACSGFASKLCMVGYMPGQGCTSVRVKRCMVCLHPGLRWGQKYSTAVRPSEACAGPRRERRGRGVAARWPGCQLRCITHLIRSSCAET